MAAIWCVVGDSGVLWSKVEEIGTSGEGFTPFVGNRPEKG